MDPVTPSPAPTFGAVLKEHRFILSLTQQALAEAVHVSRSLIKEIERGRTRPSAALAPARAAYLALGGPERAAFLTLARAPLPPALGTPLRGRPSAPCSPCAETGPPVLLLLSTAEAAAATPLLAQPGVQIRALPDRPGTGPPRRGSGPVEDTQLVLVSLTVLLNPTRLLPLLAAALHPAR